MAAGGGIVVGIGREPRPDGAAPDAPSLLFDWTALETAAECLKRGFPAWPAESGLPIVVASSEKVCIGDSGQPASRLYEELLRSGLLHVESIMAGSRAAVFLRQRQAIFGDALVILGGGTGVEHLADLYLSRRKPVVPLDLALGASRDDGTGGAMRLAKEAKAEPVRFFRFSPAYAEHGGRGARGDRHAKRRCRQRPMLRTGRLACSPRSRGPLHFTCGFSIPIIRNSRSLSRFSVMSSIQSSKKPECAALKWAPIRATMPS